MQVIHPELSNAEPVDRDDFDGDVKMIAINRPEEDNGAEVLAVYFGPGSRTRPHTHEVDQVLHVTEGNGVVATETERLLVGPGDIVVVPAGIWHWHGATPDSSFCHISSKPKGLTDWNAPEKNWASYMEV